MLCRINKNKIIRFEYTKRPNSYREYMISILASSKRFEIRNKEKLMSLSLEEVNELFNEYFENLLNRFKGRR